MPGYDHGMCLSPVFQVSPDVVFEVAVDQDLLRRPAPAPEVPARQRRGVDAGGFVRGCGAVRRGLAVKAYAGEAADMRRPPTEERQ